MKTPSITFGSLFAGIGGMDLGLERAGMACKWQVEIDTYARRVLAKHWPDVRRHDDVRTFPPTNADNWRVDLVAGGFPCQDISNAGHRVGIEHGERSGLWAEFARIIRVIRPRIVLVENVAALLVRGIDRVLWDLAACGFDAEWSVLPACAMGAPHTRERVFVVAYAKSGGWVSPSNPFQGIRSEDDEEPRTKQAEPIGGRLESCGRGWWVREPDVARVDHGLSARLVDSPNRRLGNAVVPQVAQWVGERIMQTLKEPS